MYAAEVKGHCYRPFDFYWSGQIMPRCKRCKVWMKKGIALQEGYSGIPDFIGSKEVVTMSPSGNSKLVNVWKCPKCGESRTIIDERFPIFTYGEKQK